MSSRKTRQTFSVPRNILIVVAALSVAAFVPHQVATIVLDPSTTYQTFDGWEATAQAGQIDGPLYAVHPGWANDSPVLMDLLVNDLGLTRLRVSVVSGSENPIDYYQQFKDRLIDRPSGWNPHLYDVVNDNNDPFVTDASKFHWTELDEIITMLAVPFRAKVIASGQTPYIDLCYVDFKNVSAFKHSDDPNEYAEFVLAAFQHIQATFGWVPDGLEVILEGDLADRWQDPGKIGRSLAAAAMRLAAAGFHPEFIAPSSTSLRWAVVNFDALVGVPGVLPALKTVAYHLYWDNDDENLISLGVRAKAFGLKTTMNEFIGATYLHLSNDLRKANVSAWAQYQMAAYNQNDQGAKYYIHNGTTYGPGDRTRYLRQYMRYVRPGAVRIGATSATAELTPVAFINPGGRYTVVANATSPQNFTIDNLPAGTYGIRYTTATETDVNPGSQTIAAGGLISTSIPGAGAITVFSTAAAPTPTPTPGVPSPDCTRADTVTDAFGAVWTLSSTLQTLRNGTHTGGGFGTVYKMVNGVLWVAGTGGQTNWHQWSGTAWVWVGAEPACTAVPTPTPTPPPAPFAKAGPSGGATGLSSSPTLSWTSSAGATGYEYCLDIINNSVCDTAWLATGTGITATVSGLASGTTYFWQVRATNAGGTPTYADSTPSAFWSFQTITAQKAQLTAPAPGSTLASDNVTFTWTGGLGVTQYWLQVGSAPGGADVVNVNTGSALTATVSTLPIDGRSLYVRLQSLINGVWQFNDYTLTAARIFTIQKAELVSPAPHSTLTASTVSFEWTGGSGATAYRLSVGSAPGTADLFDSDAGTDLAIVVSGLPNDGRRLFVRLWSQFDGFWESNDYELTATTQVLRKAELTTPPPGSSLTSSTVTFTWTGGIGVTATRLSVGTVPGAADLLDRDVTARVDTVVENLPTDGRALYVRLWSLVGGVWQWHDSILTAATIVAPVLAELVSPAAGSTLTQSTVTFEWTGGTGVSAYWLSVGNEPGASDIATVDVSSRLSTVLNGLPTDGRALYVRLFSLVGDTWRHNDYVLTAATMATAHVAELIRPAPESTLSFAGVLFEWTGGVGVTSYRLQIGTSPGASDLVDRDAHGSLSATVGGLPMDGRVIFVRLSSLIAGSWQFRDYTFRASSLRAQRPAELLSPAAGSRLESTTVLFRWNPGTHVSHYRLTVGTAPGSDDIASVNGETTFSALVPGLPSDGRRIYVRLYSFIAGAWQYRDYVLTTAGRGR
jgi:hypothetical protein